jgi:hypothetical protein
MLETHLYRIRNKVSSGFIKVSYSLRLISKLILNNWHRIKPRFFSIPLHLLFHNNDFWKYLVWSSLELILYSNG